MKIALLALAAVPLWIGRVGAAPSTNMQSALSIIDTTIAREVAAGQVVGLVFGVTNRSGMIALSAHGWADLKRATPMRTDSPLAIGSISKSFTAVALLRQMDAGHFDPEQPIRVALPWFVTDPAQPAVTGAELLSHTAALPLYRSDMSSSRMAAVAMRDWDMAYKPGSHFWYSDIGYQILGYALETIERRPYRDAIEQDVLQPLGMPSTAAVIDDALRTRMPVSYVRDPATGAWAEAPWFEYAAGDGSMVTTAADLAAYVRMILNGGATPEGRLLSERAFRELTHPVLSDYAFGLRTKANDGRPTLWHAGTIAGFAAQIEADRDTGIGVVLLSNGVDDLKLFDWIVDTVHRAVHGDAPEPMPLAASSAPGRLDGRYRSADGRILAVTAIDGTLQASIDHHVTPLHRIGDGIYAATDDDADGLAYIFGNGGVSHGADWFSRGAARAAPEPYRTLVGRYTAHNPEGPDARVFVRNGALVVHDTGEGGGTDVVLLPAQDGDYRPSEPAWNPERYHFDSFVAGQALRMTVSGQPSYRIDTP